MQPSPVRPGTGRRSQSSNAPRVQGVGRHSRLVEHTHGSSKQREGKTSRSRAVMEPVRPVESGFFPLDEELALVPGTLAPSLQDHLTHLASWMPFRRAAQMLERLLGVQVSEATIRRHTETMGALYEQQQTAMSQQSSPGNERSASALPAAQRLVLSGDGAYVGLVKGAWAEVRTLVIGEVNPSASAEQEVRTHALSYFSRMTDAATFAELAEVETQRRRVVQAEQVCAVTDGAEWLQGFIDLHRADALRILDFPHAAQRFGMIAEAYEQNGHPLPAQWVRASLSRSQTSGASRRVGATPCLAPAGSRRGAPALPGETGSTHAVSHLSSRRVAHWLRHRREWQQSRDASSAQRGRHALGSNPCQSDAGLTHRGMQ